MNPGYVSCISHYETKLKTILLFGFFSGIVLQYDFNIDKIISFKALFSHNVSCLIQLKTDTEKIMLAGTSDQPSFLIFDEDYNILKSLEIGTNIYYLELLDEKNVLLVSTFSMVEFYCYHTEDYLPPIKGHDNYIYRTLQLREYNIDFLATCSYDKTVKLWSIETRKEIFTFEGHNDSVWWIEYLKEFNREIIASCSSDNTLRLWNIRNLQCVNTIIIDFPNILFLFQKSYFLSNQFLLATTKLELYKINETNQVELVEKIIPETEQISYAYMVLSKNNNVLLVVGNYGADIKIFSIKDTVY